MQGIKGMVHHSAVNEVWLAQNGGYNRIYHKNAVQQADIGAHDLRQPHEVAYPGKSRACFH